MDVREALTNGFQRWLEDISPVSERGNISPGRVLDPYRTSMRSSKNLVPDLISIAEEASLTGSDPTQRFADLRNAELVEGSHDHPSLSDLGDAVLERWRALGIGTEEDEYEVPRAIVLARLGSERAEAYMEMRQFWDELRQMRSPDAWFANPHALYLVSYLDRRSTDGYRPLGVLFSAGVIAWDDMNAWQDWADEFPVPEDWEKSRLHKLLRTVDGAATRATGRVTFCQAMEALRLADTSPAELEPALVEWGISDATPS